MSEKRKNQILSTLKNRTLRSHWTERYMVALEIHILPLGADFISRPRDSHFFFLVYQWVVIWKVVTFYRMFTKDFFRVPRVMQIWVRLTCNMHAWYKLTAAAAILASCLACSPPHHILVPSSSSHRIWLSDQCALQPTTPLYFAIIIRHHRHRRHLEYTFIMNE